MILSIHQPAYLPWCGYLQRIAASDLHVVLDHVQFEKNSFINRNRIRTSDGPAWLTVPVLTSGRFGELPIRDVMIDNTQHWREKHWRSLLQSYRKAPFFAEHAGFFERVYAHRWERLIDLIDATSGYLLRAFGVQTPLLRSSELGVRGAKDELVLNLCQACEAEVYFSGALGRDYLSRERFDEAGVGLVFQDYRCMPYVQHGHSDFVPNLSAIDVLFNYGPAARLVMLRGGGATRRAANGDERTEGFPEEVGGAGAAAALKTGKLPRQTKSRRRTVSRSGGPCHPGTCAADTGDSLETST